MRKILVNYNFTPDKDFVGDDYLIYDRSDSDEWLRDFDQDRIIRTPNVGNVDYDKLNYLIDNYDSLPEVFLWGKTNLFKYITPEEYDKVKDSTGFTPLMTTGHRTYSDSLGTVCDYHGGWYRERNDSWYFSQCSSKHVFSFAEWAYALGLTSPHMIPFAPGGNYILTRDKVHRYSRDFYARMASMLPYQTLPAEAHCAERTYGLIWGDNLV